jgi:hypothetical protein
MRRGLRRHRGGKPPYLLFERVEARSQILQARRTGVGVQPSDGDQSHNGKDGARQEGDGREKDEGIHGGDGKI